MQLLYPTSEAAPDLHARYAEDWLEPGGVRVNFITSADGAAAANGRSRELQTPGDNAVFATLRDLADVILVGAATAATEGYRPSAPGPRRRAIRTELGLAPAPAIAVMSASLSMDLSQPLYTEASVAPTILLTGPSAPVARRNDVIDLAGTDTSLQLIEVPAGDQGGVDFAQAVIALQGLGYRRILCEGGPRVFGAGVAARSVSELCLSYAPKLIGPAGPRIIGGDEWPADFRPELRLHTLLEEDGALFARYRVAYPG